MLVQEWMTKDVVTISPDTSMMKASRLMKDKKIRRIPVVDENRRVVGIVSDRDVKDASPSKATTLDMHELYYLLSELKVKDIMTKDPVCAKAGDSVEAVALTLLHNTFGGMPVVDDKKVIVGIITESDIFRVLVSITGVDKGGLQLAFELPSQPGSLRPILDAIRELGAGVTSVLTSQESETDPTRKVYIRLRRLGPADTERVVAAIKERFSSLMYWEPGLQKG